MNKHLAVELNIKFETYINAKRSYETMKDDISFDIRETVEQVHSAYYFQYLKLKK